LLIAAFGAVVHRLELALWTALLLGVLSNAAMAGLYAVGPPLYPTAVRATGMGCAIGIGRLGAILAPLASGALLDRGWEAQQLYGPFSGPVAVAEAAGSALKVALPSWDARGLPGKKHFIARERSYHGNTLGALSVSGFLERRRPFEGSLLDVSFVSAANAYRPLRGLAGEQLVAA